MNMGEEFHRNVSSKRADGKLCAWTKYHAAAFIITFARFIPTLEASKLRQLPKNRDLMYPFINIFLHIERKSFSNVKRTLSDEWTPFNTSFPDIYDNQWNAHHMFLSGNETSVFLGSLDTSFMISHSVGIFISGVIGDRLDLRYVLSFAVCSSAAMVLFFGYVSELLHLYKTYWYITFWCLTGLLHSLEWPAVIAIMGNWFGKSRRGLVMGAWAASPSVGNIFGAYITAAVLHHGYQFAFLVSSCMAFCGGIIVFFSLVPSPRDVGLPDVSDDGCDNEQRTLMTVRDKSGRGLSSRPSAIEFCEAICLPGVIPYSFAYASVKVLHVSFTFWLPYYLQSAYQWKESEAGKLSIWYDLGGILGAVVVGYVTDRLKVRSPAIAAMLMLSPVVLFVFSELPANVVMVSVLMVITGLCILSAASLLGSTIPADLGRLKQVSSQKQAMATITGIIDGIGSASAAAGQQLIPIMHKDLGWQSVFYLFMALSIVGLMCIMKIVCQDTRELWKMWKDRRTKNDTKTPSRDRDGLHYEEMN